MSISSNYISFWQPFYDKVCFSGHVVNILLNYRGPLLLLKLIVKVSKLCGKTAGETYESLKTHRKFIQDLLKDQNLSPRIRKEYNTLQSNHMIWELDWDGHLTNAEKKPERFGKMNIMSFFRSKSSDENTNGSINSLSKGSSSTFDETSSLLSISEDESAIYIESNPFELVDDLEQSTESGIQNYIASSFTSARFLEWKLSESESSLNGSFYNCPLCKVTFKTGERDCISAFTIHLRAHQADCDLKDSSTTKRLEEYSVNDFECRFNYFRNDLKDLITGKSSYISIPLTFDRNIISVPPQIMDRPFKQLSLLESEELTPPSNALNPIKAFKFNPNVIASSMTPSPARSPTPNLIANTSAPAPAASVAASVSAVAKAATAAPKKPRAKKTPVPKPPATTTVAVAQIPLPASSASASVPVPAPAPIHAMSPSGISVQETLFNPAALHRSDQSILQSPAKIEVPQTVVQSPNNSTATTVQPQITVPASRSISADQSSSLTSTTPLLQIQIADALFAPLFENSTESSKAARPENSIVINYEESQSKDLEIVSYSSLGSKRSFAGVPVPIELLSADDLTGPPTPSFTDMASCYSMDGRQFGCSHYKVNCKFYAECCKRWFTCRFCHDERSNHKMNRHETRFCLCMFCGTSQKAVGRCSHPKCKSVLAHYFCDKCKFWDNDPNKLIYHCEKCGICRTGLKSNYDHCDKCGKCVAKSAFPSHHCELNSNKLPSAVPAAAAVQTNAAPVIHTATPQLNSVNQPLSLKIEGPSAKRIKLYTSNHLTSILNPVVDTNGSIPSTTVADQKMRRKCWNCSNGLPSNSDGSIQSKYCSHCSAIVE